MEQGAGFTFIFKLLKTDKTKSFKKKEMSSKSQRSCSYSHLKPQFKQIEYTVKLNAFQKKRNGKNQIRQRDNLNMCWPLEYFLSRDEDLRVAYSRILKSK